MSDRAMLGADDARGPRRRITGALFVGNALSSTAYLGIISVAALAAQELTGGPQLAGLPSAVSTVGSALGATVLSGWSRKVGRRAAFVVGFTAAAVGGVVSVASLQMASFAVLLVAMCALGFGRSVGQLSRFAAGDLWPADRRSAAIALVVWAGTIGSVMGPLLIAPASRWSTIHLEVELAGPFGVAALGFAAAALWYFVMLRPEPLTLAVVEVASGDESTLEDQPSVSPHSLRSLRHLIRRPSVQLALVAMMASQLVMVLMMTMTPVHIRHHHEGLSLVSGTMMVHTLGMFAFAPLTGALVGRLGARRVIALGAILLTVASLLSAVAVQAQAGVLTLSLFILGVGWNFGFVAGSVVLLEGLALHDRLRVQGLADSLTWISGGVAALASGFVLSAWSFQGLACLGAGLSLIPLIGLSRDSSLARRRLV